MVENAIRISSRMCIAAVLAVVCEAAAVEFDRSYSPLPNGGAEEGLARWSVTGDVNVAGGDAAEGAHCFKLHALPDKPCTMQSEMISVRRGEALKLNYRLKGADAENAAFKVVARSWDADSKTMLGQVEFDATPAEGWAEKTHELTTHAGAFYISVELSLKSAKEHPATAYADAILLYREIKYSPLYADIKPLSPKDTVYVYKKGPRSEDRQFFAMQTLQGIVARRGGLRLWIDAGDPTFVDDLKQQYGIQFDTSLSRDWAQLLEKLKPHTSGGYVLYDAQDAPSISAAATLAGVLDAVAVDVELEAEAAARGYEKAIDVRGKDCKWVYENYREKLNDNLIIVHTNSRRFHPSIFYLKDWATATQALSWWYADEDVSRAVYRSMAPCSPVYGWLDAATRDEGLSVKIHSEEGLFQIPSDWMVNLSVHAAMGRTLQDKSFRQKAERKTPAKESGVHYVTFILSDMDNILTEIGTNSFVSQKKFYRNPHRGEFPMTWGMAPSLVELSPNGVDLWYRNATDKDIFIAYCGLGYSYPASSPYLQTHAQRLGEFMQRADLRVLLLIDYLLPKQQLTQEYYQTAKWFTALEQVRGIFYLEYIQYAPHGGKIFWFDGKPMVTARFDFRQETFYPAVRPTAEALAESINALPADPTSPDGYTAVTVHAWSRGLDDIYATLQQLDSHVRVVNAEEFIELIRMNVPISGPQTR